MGSQKAANQVQKTGPRQDAGGVSRGNRHPAMESSPNQTWAVGQGRQGRPLDTDIRRSMESLFSRSVAGIGIGRAGTGRTQGQPQLNWPGGQFENEAERMAHWSLAMNGQDASMPDAGKRRCDFSGVRIHTDASAARMARSMGAEAFTRANHIGFVAGCFHPRSTFGRRLLAHELTHVVQQTGTAPAASIGLDLRQGGLIQRYTRYTGSQQTAGNSLGWKHPAGDPLRVSDDGQMVVEDKGWGANKSKRAWTTDAKIANSNVVLSRQGARAKLVLKGGGDSLAGRAPETKANMGLKEIEPVKASTGGALDLRSDCGSAAKQLMGSGPLEKDVAVLKGEKRTGGLLGGVLGGILGALGGAAAGAGLGFLAGGPIGAIIGAIIGGLGLGAAGAGTGYALSSSKRRRTQYLSPRLYHGGTPNIDPTTPEEYSEELFKKEFGAGLTRQQAYARYNALSPSAKDAFDRKYGINKYAVPKVGQGLTVGTEYDMPGYMDLPPMTWNFHYATAVMESGHDYVTLENAYGWSPTDWIFFMYGPASKVQSFHEFHGATHTHGSSWTTFVVQPEKLMHVKTAVANASLHVGDKVIKLALHTPLEILESGVDENGLEWHTVKVESGPHAAKIGRIRTINVS